MTAAASQNSFNSGAATSLNAIVLDDDRFDRKRLARWARAIGPGRIQLREAADLAQFSEMVARQRFDLAFIDFCLADGNGLDAMDSLAVSARNATAYVVMISGRDDDVARQAALLKGCDQFLPKETLDKAVFRRIVRNVTKGTAPVAPGPEQRSAVDFWAARARRRDLRSADTVLPSAHKDDGSQKANPKVHLPELGATDEFVFRFSKPQGE